MLKDTLKKANKRENSNTFEKVINWMVDSGREPVVEYVEKLKSQHPGIPKDKLAWLICRKKSFKSGMYGAFIGGIPGDVFVSWKLQIAMAMAVAHAYGYDIKQDEVKTDIYIILAGDTAREALKKAGVNNAKDITKRGVKQYITREVMISIWKTISRMILNRAGKKTFSKVFTYIPILGIPVAFAFDWYATHEVGFAARRYYRG